MEVDGQFFQGPPLYTGKMAKKLVLVYSCTEKSFHIFLPVLKEQSHVKEEVLS